MASLVFAEARRDLDGRWRIWMTNEMGAQAASPTRREALEHFKRHILPAQTGPVILLIYSDLGYLYQVWRFRRGRARQIPITSWLTPVPRPTQKYLYGTESQSP